VSGEAPVVFSAEADARRRRANGPEIALWIIGIVLLIASGVFTYEFSKLIQAQTVDTNAQTDVSFFLAFTQAATIFTPGLVTAGVLCIALALFMRGLDINARRRDAAMISPQLAPIIPVAVPGASATPAAAQAPPSSPSSAPEPTTPGDYSAFMRPADEPTDPAP
jgi:hypothetical protein